MLWHALLTARDWGAVLPLSADRKPLVPFADASRDALDVAALWSRWPCAGVGLCAWDAGLVVLDVEHIDKGGADGFATMRSLVQVVGPLPRTRTHSTKSGGRHLIYRTPSTGDPLRSAQGVLRHDAISAPGLDIVTGRAVLRWPPTPGYTLTDDRPAVELPAAWALACSEPPPVAVAPLRATSADSARRYALACLDGSAADFAALGAGRNTSLIAISYRLGRLVPHVSPDEIEAALWSAAIVNGAAADHGERSCRGTIRRGIRAGARSPRPSGS